MVELVAIGLVVAGVVLLLAGAALSVYGVALLGALLGGGVGFTLAPTIGGALGVEGLGATVAGVVVGGAVGIVVAYALLSLVVAAAGFAVGSVLGLFVVTDIVGASGLLPEAGVAVATGLVVAFAAVLLTRTVLIFITSFVGGAVASTQIEMADLEAAADGPAIDPVVFAVDDPLFLGLFALGVLSQIGLFKLGWFGRIAAALPGASVLTDRGESEEEAAGSS